LDTHIPATDVALFDFLEEVFAFEEIHKFFILSLEK
jgi:hypothetical protein